MLFFFVFRLNVRKFRHCWRNDFKKNSINIPDFPPDFTDFPEYFLNDNYAMKYLSEIDFRVLLTLQRFD